MKILDLKKTAVILVTMLLFLSMQISAFASDNCTVVKIPVRQIFDSEVEGIADEFSYIMTTDQSDAPMPAGSRNMQYSWTMEKNAATEIILNVKTAGQYHYNIYQTTEKKDDYKYDQNRYYVTVEAYYNESNQLKVVTIVANEKGEKIEAISFKNSYMGEEKPNLTQPSNPSQPSGPSYSDGLGKTNSVKTGDDSPVMGYFLLLFGSLICLSVLIHKKQKRNKGEEKPNLTQPSNPSQPSGPSYSDGLGKTNSVKTGDDSPVMGYFLLLFGSLICLSVLIHKKQKRNKGESQDEA